MIKFKTFGFVVFLWFYYSSAYSQLNFTQYSTIPTIFSSEAQLEDLDNDGDLDLLLAQSDSTDYEIQVWTNDGMGNFTLLQSFESLVIFGFDIGDFNDDGFTDIFIASYGINSPYYNTVWLNNGDATFTPTYQQLGFRSSGNVTVADFDGDGDLDAVVGNSGNFDRENILWLNDGNGFFSQGNQLIGNNRTFAIESTDIDNDGDIDLICANAESNKIWKNDGLGFFTETQSFENISTGSIAIADIDNDGDTDLVFSNYGAICKLYKNDGNGIFNYYSTLPYNAINTAVNIKFTDFDSDGDQDMVAGLSNSGSSNEILMNDGNGNFTQNFIFLDSDTWDVSIGDIDNDNDTDVFFLNSNNQNSEFWRNDSSLNLPENKLEEAVLYPIPFSDNLSVDLKVAYDKFSIRIYDLTGKTIYNKKISNKRFININSIETRGTYILEIKTHDNVSKTFKIMKE